LLNPTLIEAASGTHALLAALSIQGFTITNAGATVTNAAGLHIDTFAAGAGTDDASGIKILAAPTGATNNYSLWVAGGSIRLDGFALRFGASDVNGNIQTESASLRIVGPTGASSFIALRIGVGSGHLKFEAASGGELARLTDSGILALGTTVTTSAGVGDIVVPNASGELRSVNAAGTDTVSMVFLDANNLVNIGGGDTGTAGPIINVIATASLPAAAAAQDGRILIEDNGVGDRNLIIYAGGQRFRIDGGANV
jgi:hypothetical protein